MKSMNFMRILVATLCTIILIGIAGCGGTETETVIETIVQITEPANNTSTQQNTIHILGKVENTDTTMAKVTVNGKEQKANIVNGSFDANITLIDGNNIIKVSVDGVNTQVSITKIKQTTDGSDVPVEKESKIIGKDGAPMVLIPAGEFKMGDAFNEGDRDERPVHTVYLDAFYIDIYEVTNAQYKKFMDATGYKAPYYWNDQNYKAPNNPVVSVSWNDAKAYTDWAGKRLPTEAEWEKAARGTDGRKFPWSNQNFAGDLVNFADRNLDLSWADPKINDGYRFSAPVGSYPKGASPYGVWDMAGNVWEWVADWYDETYYRNALVENPQGPQSGQYHVHRSNSWARTQAGVRAADRKSNPPDRAVDDLGFRCALSP